MGPFFLNKLEVDSAGVEPEAKRQRMVSIPGGTASAIQSEVPIPTPAPLVGSGTASQVSDRAPIDVAELFAEFPEISAEDRVKIENFESEQCENDCMRSAQITNIQPF